MKYLLVVLLLFTQSALAARDTGGGDICELNIKNIAADIKSWITQGGSKDLNLPKGMTTATYDKSMVKALNSVHVSCTDQPIFIGVIQKTCENFADSKGISRIVCNRAELNQTDIDGQYKLIHHEYAGRAGVEPANGEDSNYVVSDQISEFLESKEIRRLAVRKIQVQPEIDLQRNFGDFLGLYRVVACSGQRFDDQGIFVQEDCKFSKADIFLGSQYHSSDDVDGLYLALSDPQSEVMDLASIGGEGGQKCVTDYGHQYCDTPRGYTHYQLQVAIEKLPTDLVHLHLVLNIPTNGEHFFHRDLDLTLKSE